MVRLLRLTTDDPNANFDNNFKQDIIITPKSKIALKSLTLEVDTSELKIDSTNDVINYQVSSTQGQKTTQLAHNLYSGINVNLLFNDMDKKLNAQLTSLGGSSNDNIGIQIRNRVNPKTTKFETNFHKSRLGEHFNNLNLVKGNLNVISSGSTGSKTFRPDTGAPSGNDCFFYDNREICKGAGVFRIKISTLSGVSGDRFIIGLSSVNPDTLPDNTSFDINNIKFGIKVSNSSSFYSPITNGTIGSPSAFNPALNDIVEMGIDQGKVIGRIWKTANASEDDILSPQDYNLEDLYPVIIFLGTDTQIRLRNLRYTPNPYHPNSDYSGFDLDNEGRLGATPPNQGNYNKPTEHFLEFEGTSLSNFLGFNNTRIPQFYYTNTFNFNATADRIFRPNNISDAFIVEMLNLGLQSYDGLTSDRKSYLSVIPKSDSSGGVVYDSVYPIFIDVNNAETLSIRNIRCRILNNDLSPVNMLGLATLSILIEDGLERKLDIFN